MAEQYKAYATNPNKMKYKNGNIVGDGWHIGPPGMKAGGTITFTRYNRDDSKVYYEGNLSTTRVWGSYGYPVTAWIFKGSNKVGDRIVIASIGGTGSTKISGSFDLADNDTDITIHYYCNDENIEGNCTAHGDDGSNHKSPDVVVFKMPAKSLPYEPYKKPTIGISGDDISIYNKSRNIWIDKNSSGDKNSTNVSININGHNHDTDIGNSGKNYPFIPSDNGVSDASSYTVKATRTHSKKSDLSASASKTLYTYRTPVMKDVSVQPNSFSGFGNSAVSWNTNPARWDLNKENYFKTYIKLGQGNFRETEDQKPTGNNQNNLFTLCTQNITKDVINEMLTDKQRSQPSISTTLTMRRLNPSSNVASDVTKNINIQFAPKYRIINLKFINKDTGEQILPNDRVYLNECKTITVKWDYTDSSDRGIVSGYLVEVFSDKDYKNLVTSKIAETLEQDFTVRTELNRGYLNYIKITPFYIAPDKSVGKLYGPELRSNFVLPIGKLKQPKIPYPVNNSVWHNSNFRILCELSEDDDYDVLKDIIDNNTYRYKDIEVVINNISYTYSKNPNIFSTDILGYTYRICINPSLISNFEITNSYKIKIRVQKNYFINLWSEYSEISITTSPINILDIKQYTKVLADQYKYVRNNSIRLYNTYPISKLPNNNVDNNIGDIIYANHYKGIYDTILQIQRDVNNWAKFDNNRFNVKFNTSINLLSGSDGPKQDIITALKDTRPNIIGRNYNNILIDCMNQLK